uniref:Uncharacterized protein n=1 Tax=Raoultella ornithinolytica TaxID=54291 RepID=A0A7G9A691_RAOOR|nr:Hypothetical protein [Raoultella ornithinolytica]
MRESYFSLFPAVISAVVVFIQKLPAHQQGPVIVSRYLICGNSMMKSL